MYSLMVRIEEDSESREYLRKRILLREREDGWYAQYSHDGEWERVASSDARIVDVKQLLRKEYDVRY